MLTPVPQFSDHRTHAPNGITQVISAMDSSLILVRLHSYQTKNCLKFRRKMREQVKYKRRSETRATRNTRGPPKVGAPCESCVLRVLWDACFLQAIRIPIARRNERQLTVYIAIDPYVVCTLQPTIRGHLLPSCPVPEVIGNLKFLQLQKVVEACVLFAFNLYM